MNPHPNHKPECPYCGAIEGLRIKSDGGGYEAPEYTCEGCFTGTDTGPSFDDLPTSASDIRRAAIEDVLSLLTAHELYRYRPKAFNGFIEYARTELAITPSLGSDPHPNHSPHGED